MKITELPRISSSPCSGRRSTQKRLELRLLPRSLMLPLRVTLLALTLFFSFMSLLSSSPASALSNLDDGTVTPTATFHPLFPTATPGIGGLDCPEGVPLGWGTVTPNPMWSVLCGGCAPTALPYPTGTGLPSPEWVPTLTAQADFVRVTNEAAGTVYPTGTAAGTVTSTPTVMATSTPVPMYSGTLSCISGSFTCTSIDPYHLRFTSSSHLIDPGNFFSYDGIEDLRLDYVITGNVYSIACGVGEFADDPYIGSYVHPFTGLVESIEGACWLKYVPTGSGSIIFGFEEYDGSWGLKTAGGRGEVDVEAGAIVVDIYSQSGSSAPTVTPTPDPSTLSYCSIVDDTDDSSSFELPVIRGGTPKCGGAGGFIIPFSWFQLVGIELDDLIIPYIEVCFVPTSFGQLKIADNVIDLDIVAYILGALFLLSLVV